MTENQGIDAQGMGGTIENSANFPPAQATAPQSVTSERLFTQQEVNDLAGRIRKETVERHPRVDSINSDEVKRIAAEEFKRLQEDAKDAQTRSLYEQEAQRTLTKFSQSLVGAKEKYQDFDEHLSGVTFENYPHIINMSSNTVDNTADVVYELMKDPLRMAAIENLAAKDPRSAENFIKKMSSSIKDSQAIKNAKVPNEPLSQLRPSKTGTDNGVMTAADYRKKYRGYR